jgi:hypothetical protein
MIRHCILPLVLLAAACGRDSISTAPAERSNDADLRSASFAPSPREALARRLARALADSGFREHLHAQLDSSAHPEGKILLADLLTASGGQGLRALGAAGGALSAAERLAAEAIEVYLPVPAHRAAWRGGATLLVGTIGADGEIPVAFDPRDRRVLLDPSAPPAIPVIAVVPLESELGRRARPSGAVAAPCEDCGGSGGGQTGGLYMTASHLRESFESWLKGKPEIEVLVLGQQGTSDSLTSYQCGGERAAGSYYFDQNSLDWSGSALLMSRAQLDAYSAQHPGQALRLFFMEDDDAPCQIRANNTDLERLISTVDSLVRGFAGGKDVSGGSTGTIYRNFTIAQKIFAVVASAIKSNDDLIGNAVEDVVTSERYPGYNWIIKGEDGRTNGYLKLEMR